MLVIRDYSNNEYPLLAVKSINEELNGQHSIELKVPQQKNNNLDLKQIDKLWTIIYETVEYRIVYLKQITKGDSFYLDVRAIPLFYFDMDKQIIHENKDGHYTGANAFNVVFQNSGYDYALVDSVTAIQIEGFGKGETRLEMFKRLIERFGLEFYIVGKTVYLRKLIGNDTNFMYKYKLNASNVSKSIDASNFFTHIKGFGNFEEGSDDYLKDAKLKREYTSPLASVLGKYEGKPIVDGRIKDTATMDTNLKRAVEDSLEISIEGNLHDVRSIYAEAVPTIGDRVFLIDERIGLEQEIRIHTLKRTYDINDKLIDCEVTFGSQNIRDRYKSNLNSAAKDFTAIMQGKKKLPTWTLEDVARSMIEKIHSAESEVIFGDFGMMAISKTNPNHILGVNSAGLYISTDGGATARLAMTAEGIVADVITAGVIRLTSNLMIESDNGLLTMTGDTLRIQSRNDPNKYSEISPTGAYFKRGALSIERPDGALYIENGISKMDLEVQRNVFMSPGVSFEGQNYIHDGTTNYLMYENFYTTHNARYLTVSFTTSLTANSAHNSAYVNVRVRGFDTSSSDYIGTRRMIAYKTAGTNTQSITIDLGVPTYKEIQFYLEFAMDVGEKNVGKVRSNRVYMHG